MHIEYQISEDDFAAAGKLAVPPKLRSQRFNITS